MADFPAMVFRGAAPCPPHAHLPPRCPGAFPCMRSSEQPPRRRVCAVSPPPGRPGSRTDSKGYPSPDRAAPAGAPASISQPPASSATRIIKTDGAFPSGGGYADQFQRVNWKAGVSFSISQGELIPRSQERRPDLDLRPDAQRRQCRP